ncbi:unnamed protein product, partial [Symbiodinium microadriaticum]
VPFFDSVDDVWQQWRCSVSVFNSWMNNVEAMGRVPFFDSMDEVWQQWRCGASQKIPGPLVKAADGVCSCPARSCCGSAGLCQDGKLVPMTETTLLAYLDSLVGQLEGQAC